MDKKTQLDKLYANRNLLVFTNGYDWFKSQVLSIHLQTPRYSNIMSKEEEAILDMVAYELDNDITWC